MQVQSFVSTFAGAFDDEEITHVDGDVNPVRDIQTILDELRLKDVQYVQSRVEALERLVVRGAGLGGHSKHNTRPIRPCQNARFVQPRRLRVAAFPFVTLQLLAFTGVPGQSMPYLSLT